MPEYEHEIRVLNMSNIVWLSSYPKSGNTFVRFLLANYFFNDIASSVDLDNRIPGINRVVTKGVPNASIINSKAIVKTHYVMCARHPLVPKTAGFIYVLRNPKDVLLSNSRFSGISGNDPNFDVVAFANEFIQYMGVPRWIRENFGCWPEHVSSWLATSSRFPHIIVRYEDLKDNTSDELIRILQFLGEKPKDSMLERALTRSSLDAMRKIESSDKETGVSNVFGNQGNNKFFVGQGNSGQSLMKLGKDIDHKFDTRFREVMNLFGYY